MLRPAASTLPVCRQQMAAHAAAQRPVFNGGLTSGQDWASRGVRLCTVGAPASRNAVSAGATPSAARTCALTQRHFSRAVEGRERGSLCTRGYVEHPRNRVGEQSS